MSRSDDFPFVFGELTQEDVVRVLKEIEQRGYEKLEISEEMRQCASSIGYQFVEFVRSVLQELGLLTKAGIPNARLLVARDIPEDMPIADAMKLLWGERARDWAVIESPNVYVVTMETLLEHLRANPKRSREKFLSLGSGPGLYETYLGCLALRVPQFRSIRFLCADYAPQMTSCHKRILGYLRTPEGRPLDNIKPLTADMMDLRFNANSIDQILCNNALQWAADWKKAIAEMERVMDPNGLGYLYLFVHTHPMVVFSGNGVQRGVFGNFTIPELLDELEARHFEVGKLRQIAGAKGTGQAGLPINRVFVLARYRVGGDFSSWREKQVSAALTKFGASPNQAVP